MVILEIKLSRAIKKRFRRELSIDIVLHRGLKITELCSSPILLYLKKELVFTVMVTRVSDLYCTNLRNLSISGSELNRSVLFACP